MSFKKDVKQLFFYLFIIIGSILLLTSIKSLSFHNSQEGKKYRENIYKTLYVSKIERIKDLYNEDKLPLSFKLDEFQKYFDKFLAEAEMFKEKYVLNFSLSDNFFMISVFLAAVLLIFSAFLGLKNSSWFSFLSILTILASVISHIGFYYEIYQKIALRNNVLLKVNSIERLITPNAELLNLSNSNEIYSIILNPFSIGCHFLFISFILVFIYFGIIDKEEISKS
jgi:hypothetical protein